MRSLYSNEATIQGNLISIKLSDYISFDQNLLNLISTHVSNLVKIAWHRVRRNPSSPDYASSIPKKKDISISLKAFKKLQVFTLDLDIFCRGF